MATSCCPNALYAADNALVSLVDWFVPRAFSVQAAEASVSSLTLLGERRKKKGEIC